MPISAEPWGDGGIEPTFGFDSSSCAGSRHDVVFELVSHTLGSGSAVVTTYPGNIHARIMNGLPNLEPCTRAVSVFNVLLVDKVGGFSFCIDSESRVLQFPGIAATDFENIISTCAGMGIGCMALEHVNMTLRVANDVNPRMIEGHRHLHPTVPTVLGSIADVDTICEIHAHYPRSGVLFAGFNCQPFSTGGLQRGIDDDRAKVLPAALRAAYMLHSVAIVLECVRDAGSNRFVRTQVEAFCAQTGFQLTECVLSLDACWSSKRDRWWGVLAVPFVGRVSLPALPCLPFPTLLRHVLPNPLALLEDALEQLELDLYELEMFAKYAPSIAAMFPKPGAPAPTALHSWSSQVVACRCGCRPTGFAESTLASRGLFGILFPLEGVVEIDGTPLQKARHPHPTEIAILNAVPLPDSWPQDLRLTNAALGQMASPLHTNWVLSHLSVKVQSVHVGVATACPNKALDALRSQIMRQVRNLAGPVAAPQDDFDLPMVVDVQPCDPWELVDSVQPTEVVCLLGDVGHPELKVEVSAECTLRQLLSAEISLGTLPGDLDDLIRTWLFRVCPSGDLLDLHDMVAGKTIWVQYIIPLLPDDSEDDPMTEEPVPDLEVSPTVSWTVNEPEDPPQHDLLAVAAENVSGHHELEAGLVGPCPDPWSLVKQRENSELVLSDPLFSLSSMDLVALAPPRVLSLAHGIRLLSQTMPSGLRRALLVNQDFVWADDEIRWHVQPFLAQARKTDVAFLEPLFATELCHGICPDMLQAWFDGLSSRPRAIVSVIWLNGHWVPFFWHWCGDTLFARTWEVASLDLDASHVLHEQLRLVVGVNSVVLHRETRNFALSSMCGVFAVRWIDHQIRGKMLPTSEEEAKYLHSVGRDIFLRYLQAQTSVDRPWMWGLGLESVSKAKLRDLLLQHGVSQASVESRIQLFTEAVGVPAVSNALQGFRPWRALKSLGNQRSPPFQLVLADELKAVVDERAKVGKTSKKQKKVPKKPDGTVVKRPTVHLDPAKLQVERGTFQVGSKMLSQLQLRQIGPFSEGVVLTTIAEASKFLQANHTVTPNALGLLLINVGPDELQTDLKWSQVRVILRCAVDQEPILVPATLVQLGEQQVVQPTGLNLDALPDVPATCLKISIYRDEVETSWDEVVAGSVKFLMKHLPLLTPCREDPSTCDCAKLHVGSSSPVQEPVLDLWRRQWLSSGFKQCNADMAALFMVNVRLVESLLKGILSCSGHSGIYIEPRSLDALKPHESFQTIWVPRTDVSELQRRQQLDPQIIGLCRLGSRLGVRVATQDAKEVAMKLRPDSVYLAAGSRMMFEVGPIPFGMDRLAVTRLCSNWGWEAKPLNPSRAVGELGMIWKVQSCKDPPKQVVLYRGGEILISKLASADRPETQVQAPLLANAKTLAKCVAQPAADQDGVDPWLKQDPWGGKQLTPAPSTAEIEERLHKRVLESIGSQQGKMEVDTADQDSRIQALEKQIQSVHTAQIALEHKVDENNKKMDHQVAALQDQVGAQFTAQGQRIQELFNKQMHEMEALLTKRSRSRSRRE